MEDEIDIVDVIRDLWKKKFIILAVTIIAAVIGSVYSYCFITPLYKSYTTVLVQKSEINRQGISTDEMSLHKMIISTFADLLKSKTVIKDALNNLHIEKSLDDVQKRVITTAKVDNELITLEVSDTDAVMAKNIANEMANVFKSKIANDIFQMDNVFIIDDATETNVPYNVHHSKDIFVAAAVGFVSSVAVIFVIYLFKNSNGNEK